MGNADRERKRRYERAHRDKERARHRRWRAGKPSLHHGKTKAEVYALLEAQGSCCAICKSIKHEGRGWHGDHDHKTGAFRGVLCAKCNLGLGHFRDNLKFLNWAVRYLERHAQLRALL